MDKEQVKEKAIEMIKSDGLINLSRSGLCEAAGIPNGSFPHVMGCTFSDFVEELKEFDNGSTSEVNKTRTDPDLRKDQILKVAVEMAKKDGYHKITRDGVCKKAGVSAGLISRYFNTMIQLRRSIMRVAVHQEIPEIIAQGIGNNDVHAKKASPELKRQALDLMANY